MKPKTMYLALCIAGTLLPYSQFLPFVLQHGLDVRLFVEQLFATPIGGFFGLDAIVSSVVLWVFVIVDGRRAGMKRLWRRLRRVSPWACRWGCRCFSTCARHRSGVRARSARVPARDHQLARRRGRLLVGDDQPAQLAGLDESDRFLLRIGPQNPRHLLHFVQGCAAPVRVVGAGRHGERDTSTVRQTAARDDFFVERAAFDDGRESTGQAESGFAG